MRLELRACLFELAGQQFGIPLATVQEVVPMAALSHPPAIPVMLEGFLNRRGVAIPVLRTATLFGLPQDPLALHTPLIILRGAAPLALLVNQIVGIETFAPEALAPAAAADSFNGCISGSLTTASGPVHMLSLERLLLEQERRTLEQFRAMEIGRLRQLDHPQS